MEHEDAALALLGRGVACGALGWLVALAGTWLLVAGPTPAGSPATVADVFVDAHNPLAAGSITALDPLTWFDVPSRALYLLPPLVVASAGVVAGRLTKRSDIRTGASAGASAVLGYVPLLGAVALWVDDGSLVLALGVATAVALVSGVVGGVVGVRT